MYSKRKLVEFIIPLEYGQSLRLTHDTIAEEIYVQEVYPNGEDGDDLMTIKQGNLTDIIEVLKEIRGY
jgi:hypothetical protein